MRNCDCIRWGVLCLGVGTRMNAKPTVTTLCNGCRYIRFGEIKTLLPYLHKTSWMCVKKQILFGENKGGGQVDYPKTCEDKELNGT